MTGKDKEGYTEEGKEDNAQLVSWGSSCKLPHWRQ